MIGSIIEIIDNRVLIKLAIDINKQPNLVGLHVVFEDENLYEAIRLALGDKVLEYHKNTITITLNTYNQKKK